MDEKCCGDSEADDDFDHSRKPNKMTTSTPLKNLTRPRTSVGNVSTGDVSVSYSEILMTDSYADPTYEPSDQELANYSRTSRFDNSSNDEDGIVEGDSDSGEDQSEKSNTNNEKRKAIPPTLFSKPVKSLKLLKISFFHKTWS